MTSIETVEAELRNLLREDATRWQRIATLLMRVEEQELWRGRSNSFSSWLRALGGDPPGTVTLWRYLVAARFYLDLRRRHRSLPPLGSALASPAVLELARKIARALPPDVADPLAMDAARGKIGRPRLSRIWAEYRPALRGRTFRGRGVVMTSKDLDEELLARGRLLDAVRAAGASWIPGASPETPTRLHADVDVGGLIVPGVVTTPTSAHAVDPWGAPLDRVAFRRATARDMVERLGSLWIVVGPKLLDDARTTSPLAGVLLLHDDQVEVVTAPPAPEAAAGVLALALLPRLHGWTRAPRGTTS